MPPVSSSTAPYLLSKGGLPCLPLRRRDVYKRQGMSFPLTCNYYVSQHYGHNGHKGVDIAGANINGQPVYAAAGGTVISLSLIHI